MPDLPRISGDKAIKVFKRRGKQGKRGKGVKAEGKKALFPSAVCLIPLKEV